MNKLSKLGSILAGSLCLLAQGQGAEDRPAETYLPDEGATLPFQVSGGCPVVECEINGRGPYRVLVDTGAATSVLDQRLADELALPVLGETAIGDPSDPSRVRAKRVRIDEIRLADAAFGELTAVAWPQPAGLFPPGVRGILGLPLFAGCTLTVDYPRGELRLRGEALPEPDGHGTLAMTRDPEGGLFCVPIQVAGRELLAHLDSGNSGSLGLPAEWVSQVTLVPGSRKEGSAQRANGAVKLVLGRLDGSVRIGATVLERPEVHFGASTRGNLGYDILRHFAVTIDSRNLRIRFEPPAEPTPATPAEPK